MKNTWCWFSTSAPKQNARVRVRGTRTPSANAVARADRDCRSAVAASCTRSCRSRASALRLRLSASALGTRSPPPTPASLSLVFLPQNQCCLDAVVLSDRNRPVKPLHRGSRGGVGTVFAWSLRCLRSTHRSGSGVPVCARARRACACARAARVCAYRASLSDGGARSGPSSSSAAAAATAAAGWWGRAPHGASRRPLDAPGAPPRPRRPAHRSR